MSNKCCGVSIMFGKRFKNAKIFQPCELKGKAQGRAMGMRFKSGYYDLASIVMYFPPIPQSSREIANYKNTCKTIADWCLEYLKSLPLGTCPFIYCDLNDGMGLTCHHEPGTPAEWLAIETCAMPELACRKERIHGGAGQLLREVLEAFFMTALSAMSDDRNTFHGNTHGSLIDFIFGPDSLLPKIRS